MNDTEKPKRKRKPRRWSRYMIFSLLLVTAAAAFLVYQQITAMPKALVQLRSTATELVVIPAGTFTMGTTQEEINLAIDECVRVHEGNCQENDGEDAVPQVAIHLDTFKMEKTEVTFEQYAAFLNYLRSQGQSSRNGCQGFICIQTVSDNPNESVITFDSANYNAPTGLLKHPVFSVTWYGAATYCETMGRRLPTEAEWEYTARGTDGHIYPWGNEWHSNNAKTRIPKDAMPGTVPVGSYLGGASPFGVIDMAGNVAEWVNDWYAEFRYEDMAAQPQPVRNPAGPAEGLQKVLRGGSWDTLPFYARTVQRQSYYPAPAHLSDSYPRVMGFRCAVD